jgi:hypothetical protein
MVNMGMGEKDGIKLITPQNLQIGLASKGRILKASPDFGS